MHLDKIQKLSFSQFQLRSRQQEIEVIQEGREAFQEEGEVIQENVKSIKNVESFTKNGKLLMKDVNNNAFLCREIHLFYQF